MPRERIYPERQGTSENPSPVAEVTWEPDRYVTLGVHVPVEPVADSASPAITTQPPRELLLSDLPNRAREILDSLEREHGEPVADAVVELLLAYGEHVRISGLYMTLNRAGCQRAIKVLRRARNQAFGADE